MTTEAEMVLVALRRTWLCPAAATVTGLEVRDITKVVGEIEAAFEKAKGSTVKSSGN